MNSNDNMYPYYELLCLAVEGEVVRNERTGIDCRTRIGITSRYNVSRDDFPLLLHRRLPVKAIVAELLWFLSGTSHIRELQKYTSIWDPWADKDGNVPSAYGYFWRRFPIGDVTVNGVMKTWVSYHAPFTSHDALGRQYFDQIAWVEDQIRTNPSSRRHVVTAWHPGNATVSSLPPCHDFFQFHVVNGRMDLTLYQRSADVPVGVPFNIASYSLLLLMMAERTGYEPGEFIHMIGNAHVYDNQMPSVEKLLRRMEGDLHYPTPKVLTLPSKDVSRVAMSDIDSFEFEYYPDTTIKFPVAV